MVPPKSQAWTTLALDEPQVTKRNAAEAAASGGKRVRIVGCGLAQVVTQCSPLAANASAPTASRKIT
jgi:hypothetical protein